MVLYQYSKYSKHTRRSNMEKKAIIIVEGPQKDLREMYHHMCVQFPYLYNWSLILEDIENKDEAIKDTVYYGVGIEHKP